MTWLIGRRIPRWVGIMVQFLAFPAVNSVLPWALSLFATRHGWTAGLPGVWNLLGLIPVTMGFAIFFRCMREHFKAAPDGWLLERTSYYPTPAYLLTQGPYRYSCHPIYLAEVAIWLGWLAFYGSFVIGGIIVVAALLSPFILEFLVVRREERGLEARFGDTYREYRRTTPRWFGKPTRSRTVDDTASDHDV
jgi:protein-S-isoprenylcysteine O-methyltransferase Ste14